MRYSGSKCVAEAPPSLSGLLPVIPGTSIDFTHLCEGNDPPCDSEIPFIRDIISEALTRVDALEPQIRNSGEIPTRLVDEPRPWNVFASIGVYYPRFVECLQS
jgi:hypothetical protein